MKSVEFWEWMVPKPRLAAGFGRSQWKACEDDVRALYPGMELQRVDGTMEMRLLPESDEELKAYAAQLLRSNAQAAMPPPVPQRKREHR